MTWTVTVHGFAKGEAWKERGRWHWWIATRGNETYSRRHTMADVRAHIARCCRARPDDVRFTRK